MTSSKRYELGEYQVCPKCNGQGTVSKPPYVAGDIFHWSSTSASHVCDVCNGAKIIQRPTIVTLEEPVKEVIEEKKEWVIVSVISNSGIIVSDFSEHDRHLDWYIKQENFTIHSVRRLSDGEVFTVGDFIRVVDTTRKGWSDAITGFLINEDGDLIAEFETWRQPLKDLKRMHKDIHKKEANPVKEEIFTWTDEWVLEFARVTNTESNAFQGRYADLDQFKKSKQQPRKVNDGLNSEGEKEKIVVSFINPAMTSNVISMRLSQYITEDKHYDIRCAVEKVLNKTNEPNEKTYQQSEVLKMQEDAFNAGRGRYVSVKNGETKYDYPFFNDYLQSLKKSTKQP